MNITPEYLTQPKKSKSSRSRLHRQITWGSWHCKEGAGTHISYEFPGDAGAAALGIVLNNNFPGPKEIPSLSLTFLPATLMSCSKPTKPSSCPWHLGLANVSSTFYWSSHGVCIWDLQAPSFSSRITTPSCICSDTVYVLHV